jgi:hypothetical protein
VCMCVCVYVRVRALVKTSVLVTKIGLTTTTISASSLGVVRTGNILITANKVGLLSYTSLVLVHIGIMLSFLK